MIAITNQVFTGQYHQIKQEAVSDADDADTAS